MVGDSRNDIEAAQRLSMPVIYVTYGYNRGEDLAPMVQANALPGQVIGSIQELPKLLPPTGGSRACN